MRESNGNTIKYRLDDLERNYDKLDVKISLILENHLPHLKEQITALETKITMFTAINIGAIVMGLLISRLIK